MKTKPSITRYSEVLSEFIEPMLGEEETEETFLQKARAGMIIWNYCVSKENNLKGTEEMSEILLQSLAEYPQMKPLLEKFVKRKQIYFAGLSHFIFEVRVNTKPDGTKTLYVETAPADKLDKA
jgi:hypothetical protein